MSGFTASRGFLSPHFLSDQSLCPKSCITQRTLLMFLWHNDCPPICACPGGVGDSRVESIRKAARKEESPEGSGSRAVPEWIPAPPAAFQQILRFLGIRSRERWRCCCRFCCRFDEDVDVHSWVKPSEALNSTNIEHVDTLCRQKNR